jgi:redox-sensitive bicupin YhaK (pirin superfamily)
MSALQCHEPVCSAGAGAVELVIEPRERDLGGFSVRRVLPAAERRMVGPFIFFDEMGPATFPPGQGIDVRPHPHIGIATITYLFAGEIMHRDSLDFEQAIQAGAVNLMTAGRGIVHSERAGPDRGVESRLHGIQSWMALPNGLEEMPPEFIHYPAQALPQIVRNGVTLRVIMGVAYGVTSPVKTYSPTVYVEARLPAGTELALPDGYTDRAAYIMRGSVHADERDYGRGLMIVARAGAPVTLEANVDSRVMIVGGEPVGHREIWWNFVAGSKDRIEAAKQQWRDGGFGRIAGDDEFIPLPEE